LGVAEAPPLVMVVVWPPQAPVFFSLSFSFFICFLMWHFENDVVKIIGAVK
jgi:hypothetical protein